MGLTISYGLQSTAKTTDKAKTLVEKMRQLAFDLPFDRVDDEVRYLGPEICQQPLDDLRGDEEVFSSVLDATQHVDCPWGKMRQMSFPCQPLEVLSFSTVPGSGSEWACFGLARYPAEMEVTYRPENDDKFTKTIRRRGSTSWKFDWRKWERWLEANGNHGFENPEDEQFHQKRMIKTRLGTSWRFSTFCKTQYASEPACGGIPNFLKCHISLITLLDRIGNLKGVKVGVCDEGKFGRSHYSEDWREARAEGREPTYTWHEGKYDPKALVQEVGHWNEMIAAKFGDLSNLLGASGSPLTVQGPIQGYSNFEHLEFKGWQNNDLKPFLLALDKMASEERAKHPVDEAA